MAWSRHHGYVLRMTDTPQKNRRDEQLPSEDLAVLNGVLKALSRKYGIEEDREAVMRLARIIMGLQAQGVREPEQLSLLAEATME
ncbi:hypothetical protein HGP14_31920 [Rhizobium sp. P32RR-XVIII]|uniref:hypothetical protein n=1 Tax=Rhizobium sp. P32RR-XVIII TaxID=2726738 RepID=UPI0014574575|nr:hypothetical protein [Rhizobium sp. P32RR-XVIII]NLS07843.1 hypothetical protein [Rhizobium sp. P32RR-XVIII]